MANSSTTNYAVVSFLLRGKTPPAIWVFISLFLLLSIASTIIGQSEYATLLNENQVLYLFSTTGQVIAAIYGLTLTGFIFFRNELSREEFEDDTLTDAVEALKRRYFVLLAFITALVVLTILLSNLAISRELTGPTLGNVIIINTGQAAFVISLVAVAYFVFDVISPQRIAKASQNLQNEVDPSRSGTGKGSLEDFLKNYNQIEVLLSNATFLNDVTLTTMFAKSPARRVSNTRLAEILLRNERIDQSLYRQLRELITLRNSIIHGAEPIVSEKAVVMSRTVLHQLEDFLNRNPV